MSLDGGLEELEEFFWRRAIAAFNATFSACHAAFCVSSSTTRCSHSATRARSGATASSISLLTSVSLKPRSILHVVTTSRAWRKSQARILA
jgi:hypothetical protein